MDKRSGCRFGPTGSKHRLTSDRKTIIRTWTNDGSIHWRQIAVGDDYKEKLKTFIADIPLFPGQIVSGESKRPPYDKEFKDKLADPKFTMPTTELFTKYTGTAHLTLIKNWSGGGIQTTC